MAGLSLGELGHGGVWSDSGAPGGLHTAPTMPCVPPPLASPSCLAFQSLSRCPSCPPGALPLCLGIAVPAPADSRAKQTACFSLCSPGLGRVTARYVRGGQPRKGGCRLLAIGFKDPLLCFRVGEEPEVLSQNPSHGVVLGPGSGDSCGRNSSPTTQWLCDLEQMARPL